MSALLQCLNARGMSEQGSTRMLLTPIEDNLDGAKKVVRRAPTSCLKKDMCRQGKS